MPLLCRTSDYFNIHTNPFGNEEDDDALVKSVGDRNPEGVRLVNQS